MDIDMENRDVERGSHKRGINISCESMVKNVESGKETQHRN